jgi:hypothetical protein
VPLRELSPVARRLARSGGRHLHAHFAPAALAARRLGRLLGLPYSVTPQDHADPEREAERLVRLVRAA